MPTFVRNMEIKKVLKVAVVKMINDLMSVYQVSCQTQKVRVRAGGIGYSVGRLQEAWRL